VLQNPTINHQLLIRHIHPVG